MVQFPDLPIPQSIKQTLPGVPLQSFLAGTYVPPLPQGLNAANPGQQISALVVAVNKEGQALIQTPQGLTALTAKLPLAPGQQLVLEVLPKSGRGESSRPVESGTSPNTNTQNPESGFSARIVKVNGVPPEQFFPPLNLAADDEAAPASTRAEATIVRAVAPEQTQSKTATPTTPANTPAPATEIELGPSVAPNTSPSLRAVVLNAPPATTTNTPAPAATPTTTTPQATTTSPAPLPNVNPGDSVIFRIVPNSITLPSQTAAQPQTTNTQAATPTTSALTVPTPLTTNTASSTVVTPTVTTANSFNLPATIIAQEPPGEPIAHTAIGTLRLPVEVPLPKGTTLTLQVTGIEAADDAAITGLLPQGFTTGNLATDALIRGSTGLDTLLKHLFSMNPSAANQAAQTLPQPGRQFASRVLTYLDNVKSGQFTDELGNAIPRNLSADLGMPKLMQEFTSLARAYGGETQATPQQPQNWNYTLVPVMNGDEMQHMRWFKREQQGSAKNPNAKGTRFVIELETESLGEIQLDGLFFKQPKNADFDLVIRSHDPFSEEDEDAMQSIFRDFGEIAGYTGTLKFQSVDRFPVNPLNEITEDSEPDGYSA